MAQFDSSTFLSQLFWLFVSFSLLFSFIYFIAVPKINAMLNNRSKIINDNLQAAEKLSQEANEIKLLTEQIAQETRVTVDKIINDSNKELVDQIKDHKKLLSEQLHNSIDEFKIASQQNLANNMQSLNSQIVEVVKMIGQKLNIESSSYKNSDIDKIIKTLE